MKKIAIVNCGTGNLLSVQKALAHLGVEGNITTDRETITSADSVILPGVGAWDPAISYLRQNGLEEALHGFVKTGKPFLGICLGAQLLHETSEEGKQKGLGWIPGEVKLFKPKDVAMKVPHMGWNSLQMKNDSPLFQHVPEGAYTYFVHSYYFTPKNPSNVTTSTTYDVEFASSVRKDNIYGLHFHRHILWFK